MRRSSIITRLTIFILICVFVFSSLAIFIGLNFLLERYENEINSKNISLLNSICSEFEGQLNALEVSVDTYALLAQNRLEETSVNMNNEEVFFEKLFTDYLNTEKANTDSIYIYFSPEIDGDVHDVWLTIDNEKQIMRQEEIPLNRYENNINMSWFYGPNKVGKAYWVEPYYNRFDEFITSYVSPIYVEGVFVGVIGEYLELDSLKEQLDSRTIYDGDNFFVVNTEESIISHETYKEGTPVHSFIEFENGDVSINKNINTEMSLQAVIDNLDYTIHFSQVKNGWTFAYAIPNVVLYHLINEVIYIIFVILIISFSFIVLITLRIGNKYRQRFNTILFYLDRIKKGETKLKVPNESNDEIGDMLEVINETNESLNYMIGSRNNLAYYNQVSQLLNRNSLSKDLMEIMSNHEGDKDLALIYVDVDRFRNINELLGYNKGDELIQTISNILIQYSSDKIQLYHTNINEFVYVVNDMMQDAELIETVNKVLKNFGKNYLVGHHSFYLTVSIGIARYTPDIKSITDFYRITDIATNEAKLKGRNLWVMYNRDMYDRMLHYHLLERDFDQGLQDEQFVLHYQPQLQLMTNKINTVEALVRWNHPENGLMYPDSFIDFAEKVGYINLLGIQVLRMACRQIQAWKNTEFSHIKIAVNISRVQLMEEDFVAKMISIFKQEQVALSAIEFEVTESVLLEDEEASIEKLKQLEKLGSKISIDDYGVGYSALATMTNFPVHKIKMDKSIIDKIMLRKTEILIDSTIKLAHRLGLVVVAEGVEQEEQSELLKTLGCDTIQGYYYSKPLPIYELIEYIKNYN